MIFTIAEVAWKSTTAEQRKGDFHRMPATQTNELVAELAADTISFNEGEITFQSILLN